MARSSAKRILGTLFFVTALVVFLGFVFVAFANAENINDVPGSDDMDPVAIGAAVILGVIAILILLLLLIRSYDKRQAETDEAEAFFVPEEDQKKQDEEAQASFEEMFQDTRLDGPDLIVYDLSQLASQRRAWGSGQNGMVSYHFPRNIKAGVYTNDYIPIGGGKQLKLRTLLAGPPIIGMVAVTEEAEPAATVEVQEAPVEKLPGDDFMDELEARYKVLKDTGDYDNFQEIEDETTITVTEEPDEDVYYDYAGDIHDVIDVEGIGPVYAGKLGDIGVKTTARLCYEDAAHLATALGTDEKRVKNWQTMAELMKVNGIGPQYAEALTRAGIDGIQELKRRSPQRIADQINEYLGGLDSNVLGTKITARRVEGWQDAAKSMRRVRTKVPAE